LSAGQLLNIEIAVTVGVCLEFDLGKGLARKSESRATQKQFLHHWIFLPGYFDTDQRTGESFIRAKPSARLSPPSQRLPTRLTGPPRFMGRPGVIARATGRATSRTPGLATQLAG
jgi:hypothetical protein